MPDCRSHLGLEPRVSRETNTKPGRSTNGEGERVPLLPVLALWLLDFLQHQQSLHGMYMPATFGARQALAAQMRRDGCLVCWGNMTSMPGLSYRWASKHAGRHRRNGVRWLGLIPAPVLRPTMHVHAWHRSPHETNKQTSSRVVAVHYVPCFLRLAPPHQASG